MPENGNPLYRLIFYFFESENITKSGEALIGTGFPFRNLELFPQYLATFQELFPLTSDIRRSGSAALDLAYVAAGHYDAFWEMKLQPWDMAAGALMIKEAGGLVSGLTGQEDFMETGGIVAGNPKIFKALLQIVNKGK